MWITRKCPLPQQSKQRFVSSLLWLVPGALFLSGYGNPVLLVPSKTPKLTSIVFVALNNDNLGSFILFTLFPFHFFCS